MLALSIRQPYAELILRGDKPVELRHTATKIIGERFYVYAARKKLPVASYQLPVWSNDLQVATPPAWLVELAEQMKLIKPGEIERLPRGVIVGTAVIERVVPPYPADGDAGMFRWELADVRRAKRLRKPSRHPQPVWFRPF